MEMKRINAGKLRAIGYEPRERTLRVEFDDGSAIDYAGVGTEVWRRLSTSGSAWSYFRDNIEDEFSGRRGVARTQGSPINLTNCSKLPAMMQNLRRRSDII